MPRPALALGLVRVDRLHDRVELVEPGECRGAIDRIVRERALGAVAVRWATTWSASPRRLVAEKADPDDPDFDETIAVFVGGL